MTQTEGVCSELLEKAEQLNELQPLANGASNERKKEQKVLQDAYEKELAHIKEKRNKVWCDLALTLDVASLMLERHDFLESDGIGDEAKAWKHFLERFQSLETTPVLTLVSQ